MDRQSVLKLLVGTIVTLHIGFYFVKPLVMPSRETGQLDIDDTRPKY